MRRRIGRIRLCRPTLFARHFRLGNRTFLNRPDGFAGFAIEHVQPRRLTRYDNNIAVAPVAQGSTFTLDGGSAVAIVHALAATGQGGWIMTQGNAAGGDLALTIPTTAAAGTYTSDLTFTLATGP